MRMPRQLVASLEALALAIDSRDPLRQGHTRRVQAYAIALARRMRVPDRERRLLRIAALLHDIGELAIPDHLLSKPGRLSESEIGRMRSHPTAGVAFLAPAGLPEPVLQIIRHHHEHWDGSGYPGGLSGEAIPAGARILAVADALEALISDRAYRGRLRPEDAATLIESWSGIQFDPAVVRALRAHLDEILAAGGVESGTAIAAQREAAAGPESDLTDAVTHLPGARLLRQVFEQEMIRSQQSGHPFSLIAMDLDDFKQVNERLGPQTGDRLLMEVGRVLRSHLRERDVLVRLAEDEYAALLPGSGFAAASLLAERLRQAVDGFVLRIDEAGRTARAGLSAGIAIYPLDGESLDEVMTRATLNQIHDKRARKSARAAAPNVILFPRHLA